MGLDDSLMEFSPGSAFKSASMVLGNGCQVAMIGREGRIRGMTRFACKYRSQHKSDILPWISDAFFQSRAAYLMNRNISDHKRAELIDCKFANPDILTDTSSLSNEDI